MLILGVETSTLQGSVALARQEGDAFQLLAAKIWYRQRSHGELVTPAIEEVLRMGEAAIENVDTFAVGIGPGSFTGIRVAINAVKTLAYSLEKPVYAFTSLELLALAVPQQKMPLLTLINAHKNQNYVQPFKAGKSSWKAAGKPKPMTADAISKSTKAKHLCVGEGFTAFEKDFSPAFLKKAVRVSSLSDYPNAMTLVRVTAENLKKKQPLDWKSLEPLYIRGSEAEEKLRSGTLKPLPEF